MLIASPHLCALFAILDTSDLALNREKCVFVISEHRPFWDNVQVILF
jgi:hypothetical protein